jgi:Fe-S oxidoreductase
MRAVVPILGTGPAAVELIDESILAAAAAQPIYTEDVATLRLADGGLPAAVLYVSWFLEEMGEAEGRFDQLEAAVPDGRMIRIRDGRHAERLWSIRKVGLGLISKAEGTCIPMPGLEDCAVGAEQLAGFIEEFDALFARHGREAVHYAHASVGLLHLRPRIDIARAEDRTDFLAMGREALEIVRAHGGSISGEHGDGRIRSELMHAFYGDRLVEAFREVKRLFDPKGLLNPGDKVEVRDPMGSLRRGFTSAPGEAPSIETYFSFAEEGSFAKAASACDGNGLCRRARGGAMCPSYRVTREERHATRGRANALGAAIRGEFDMNDPELHETFSLCVSCKACRHECPSNVDVARLKSEYLAQRWKSRRAPLKDVFMGQVFHVANSSAAMLPWFSNGMAQFGPTRWLISKLLGISSTRTLPRFARTLKRRMQGRRSPQGPGAPVVLLFPDCFNNCNEPGNGVAAVELLEAFGYRVILPGAPVCCGRAAISGGFLPKASELIKRSSRVLANSIEEEHVVGIVALEPSCASALQQEWLELRTAAPRAELERIAGMTDVLEGFLLDRWEDHPIRPDFAERSGDLVVHQHCHMKHTGNRIGALLERCLGRPVEVADSGCCGMAGSFGYLAENQEVSFAMAEDSLGRYLHDFTGTVVAPGNSCRQQVHDVFASTVVHPAVYLREALVPAVTR